jgi:hypothetical protein
MLLCDEFVAHELSQGLTIGPADPQRQPHRSGPAVYNFCTAGGKTRVPYIRNSFPPRRERFRFPGGKTFPTGKCLAVFASPVPPPPSWTQKRASGSCVTSRIAERQSRRAPAYWASRGTKSPNPFFAVLILDRISFLRI